MASASMPCDPPGLFTALLAPLRGVGTVFVRPRLWPLAAIPTVLLGGSIVGGLTLGARVSARYAAAVERSLGASGFAHLGVCAARILVTLVLTALVVLVATLVIPMMSAPFMDALAERVDRGAAQKHERLSAQLFRSVRVAVAGLVMVGVPQLFVWGLSLAMPLLMPVWLGIGVAVSAFGLAFDALDWPLSRRGLGVRERLAWMNTHARLTVGLGLGVWLLAWIPGLQIVLLPAIVVGGVSIVNAQETADARRFPTSTAG